MGWGKIIDAVLVIAVVALLVGYAFTVRRGKAGSGREGQGFHANADSCCGRAKMARCFDQEVKNRRTKERSNGQR